VAKTTAAQHGWTTGDVVPVEFPTTGKHELRVAGIFDRKGFIDTPYVMSLAPTTSSPAGASTPRR
jgi:hypothetical protein